MTYPMFAFRFRMFALVACLVCEPVRANDRYDAWQAEHPFTQTAWETHVYDGSQPTDVTALHGAGLNTAFDGVRSGSTSSKHPPTSGIPSLLLAYSGHGSATGINLEGFIADYKAAAAVQDDIIAIVLGDEVESAEMIAHMRKARDWIINSKDPKIARLLTLTSAPYVFSSDRDHFEAMWDRVHAGILPDAWLAQIYPFSAGEVALNAGYYGTMEWYFTWAKEKDVAMWVWNQVYSSGQLATESQFRLQKFAGLAYGARGFSDFLWPVTTPPTVAGGAYWDPGTNNPTAIYHQQAIINKEVANIAKGLIRLTPIRAYHVDVRDGGDDVRHFHDSDADLPAWLRRTGRLAGVAGVDNGNHLLVGFFRDAAGEEYFMVVNKDFGPNGTQSMATVNLTFAKDVQAIQRLGRADGAVETIPVQNNFIFELPAGTGDLFKIGDQGSFAGVDEIALPKLVKSDPAEGKTLGKLKTNSVTLEFDAPARRVVPEIRRLGKGKPIGEDIGPGFRAAFSDDGKKLILTQDAASLNDQASYQINLRWADAKPMVVKVRRGDVNGDGQVTAADAVVVKDEQGKPEPLTSADVNGDGAVSDEDAAVMQRLLNPVKLQWRENFDKYTDGPLVGQGPWLAVETLPATAFTKGVVQGHATVTKQYGSLQGPRKLQGGPYPDYRGNEAIFFKDGGFGDSGILRVSMITRLGEEGVERVSMALFNSRDTSNSAGAVHIDVLESNNATLYTSRGVTLIDDSDGDKGDVFTETGARQNIKAGKGVRVSFVVDFDASTITWNLENLDTKKQFGPRTVRYKGNFNQLDGVGFWICGQEAQLDDISIQNF